MASFIDQLHKTLRRQINKHLGPDAPIPPLCEPLLRAISESYVHADEDRALTERAFDLSSQELITAGKQAEQQTALLRAILESTTDGFLIVGGDGKVITYNDRFVTMWNLPEELVRQGDDSRMIAFVSEQLVDPSAFTAAILGLYSRPNDESSDELEFADGKIYERHSKPLIVRGQYAGRVWSFRDITNQRQNERQLQEHINELERTNKLIVDRELKMIELKEELAAMKQQRELSEQ